VQLGNLTGLLAKIHPAVEATQYQGERSAKNYGFVDAVARKNVELTAADIQRRSTVLADLEKSGAIKIVGSMYNLETGALDFFGNDLSDDDVLEKGRPEVGDLMLQRDPQVSRDSVGWGDATPIVDDRLLHPLQVGRVVDMTHVVDVGRIDRDRMTEHWSSNQERCDALTR